jgi:hypothetical protein
MKPAMGKRRLINSKETKLIIAKIKTAFNNTSLYSWI